MARLLIIDPLDLTLCEGGDLLWDSRSCFASCLDFESGLVFEYVSGLAPELCRLAKESDGVILGGSASSAWTDSPENDLLLDLIAICRHTGIPFLGVCFGAQLLGRALGGLVGRNPYGIELGAPAIRISKKGRQHFLFEGLGPGSLQAVETHSDSVLTLPPDCELLASTEHTPVQAFSYRDLLIGVQFHPEMNGDDLRCLWRAFEVEGLVETLPEDQRLVIDSCVAGRVPRLLMNFARRVKAACDSRQPASRRAQDALASPSAS